MAYLLIFLFAMGTVIAIVLAFLKDRREYRKVKGFKNPANWGVLSALCLAVVVTVQLWPEEIVVDLNDAELSQTTKAQEAVLLDLYECTPEAKFAGHECEAQKYVKEGEEALTRYIKGIFELQKRGLITFGRFAAREFEAPEPYPKTGQVNSNVFLTEKGEELAKDLQYLRDHPEVKVLRPIE